MLIYVRHYNDNNLNKDTEQEHQYHNSDSRLN